MALQIFVQGLTLLQFGGGGDLPVPEYLNRGKEYLGKPVVLRNRAECHY